MGERCAHLQTLPPASDRGRYIIPYFRCMHNSGRNGGRLHSSLNTYANFRPVLCAHNAAQQHTSVGSIYFGSPITHTLTRGGRRCTPGRSLNLRYRKRTSNSYDGRHSGRFQAILTDEQNDFRALAIPGATAGGFAHDISHTSTHNVARRR